jgi:hypothetical protein
MKTRLACLLAVAALMFAVPVIAQTTQSISGTVVSSTSDSLVIRTDDGTERTFKVDANSKLPSSLANGSRVTVNFHRMEGGVDHAGSVTMATADTTPAPADPGMRTDAPSTAGELPATAGPVPHMILIGLSALAAGLGLRRYSRQS